MSISRRKFINTTSALGLGAMTKVSPMTKPSNVSNKLSIGVIGVGMRGQGHVDMLLARQDCEVTAICDIDAGMLKSAKAIYNKHGKSLPHVYTGAADSYKSMLDSGKLDAVIIATPWELHTEMAVYAMNKGVYVGVEVCGAFSLDECWEMVETYEATGNHLFFLENVCYRRDVMAVLNMVREGLFGTLIHLECGYQHDLRAVKFNNGTQPYGGGVEYGDKGYSEAKWRTVHSQYRNGDLYPTHGIGPIAQYTNINYGNRILYLTSMASKARGLHEYIVGHPQGGMSHPNAKVEWALGDKITTMLKTFNGESIVIHHDTNLPRPYSLGFRVQGTKGLWMDVNKSLHIEGLSEAHRWESTDAHFMKYDHHYWQDHEKQAEGAGHGGMDWFLLDDFVRCAKSKSKPPFDVYDAATWMAITPLSEQSISMGSQPMAFPDFTRGRWMHRKNEFAV